MMSRRSGSWWMIISLVGAAVGCGSKPEQGGAPDAATPDAASTPDADTRVAPSNGGATGPLRPTSLTIGISGSFDTSNECTASSRFGTCATASQLGGADLCVCRADDVTMGDLDI